MKYRTRTFYTEADKALMWDRWQKGALESVAMCLLNVIWRARWEVRIGKR